MKTLNLNSLRVFAAVARHGNMQRAANALNLTRGAVSQRIRQLEIDLGVILLERQPRGVALTAEGQRCRDAVDAAMATLESMFAGIAAAGEQVTLHLGSSTASKWLMPRMEDFSARFPRVALRTEVHDQPMSRDLARNEIAIWPGKPSEPTPFRNTRALTGIRLVAVCSPDFPGPDGPVALDSMLSLPLLQDAHRHWDRLIAANGQGARHKLLNFDRSALALDAAIEGHGLAIAPTYLVESEVAKGRLVVVWANPEPPTATLFVSWSDTHVGQPDVRRIVDWIVAQFAPL